MCPLGVAMPFLLRNQTVNTEAELESPSTLPFYRPHYISYLPPSLSQNEKKSVQNCSKNTAKVKHRKHAEVVVIFKLLSYQSFAGPAHLGIDFLQRGPRPKMSLTPMSLINVGFINFFAKLKKKKKSLLKPSVSSKEKGLPVPSL